MEELNKYDYTLPKDLIAETPSEPRDTARLFVYDTVTDTITLSIFSELTSFLPSHSLMVLNDTKVIPARVHLLDSKNKRREAFFLVNERIVGTAKGIEVRTLLRKGADIGESFSLDKMFFEVIEKNASVYTLSSSSTETEFRNFLLTKGETPIPPYIKNTSLSEKELRTRYQTLFAREESSVAAPTASLHFTNAVFESLEKKEIEKTFVTLHVGLGTFAPLTSEHIARSKLHAEFFSVLQESAEKIAKAKKESRDVVAVGTTVVRTLESAADSILVGNSAADSTDIFIKPPFDFQIPDILITNFHVPKSSLLMLVDAFLSYKGARRNVIDLYKVAIEEKLRFFSFGDSMLIR